MIGRTLREELISVLIDTVNDRFKDNDTDFEELHNYAFNEDYYIIGYYQATQWLKRHDICAFDAIQTVVDWENENCGEVTTDINSESIVNMYAYIEGENLLSEVELCECTKVELIKALKEKG